MKIWPETVNIELICSGGSRIFPRGGANSQKCYYFSIFCRKLHENERIWTPRGGARVPGAPPWIRQCPSIWPCGNVLVRSFAIHLASMKSQHHQTRKSPHLTNKFNAYRPGANYIGRKCPSNVSRPDSKFKGKLSNWKARFRFTGQT